MSVIYDSNWKSASNTDSEEKRFRVRAKGPYGTRRELIMTGTSKHNIYKQLERMIEEGDCFWGTVVTEIKR